LAAADPDGSTGQDTPTGAHTMNAALLMKQMGIID